MNKKELELHINNYKVVANSEWLPLREKKLLEDKIKELNLKLNKILWIK